MAAPPMAPAAAAPASFSPCLDGPLLWDGGALAPTPAPLPLPPKPPPRLQLAQGHNVVTSNIHTQRISSFWLPMMLGTSLAMYGADHRLLFSV